MTTEYRISARWKLPSPMKSLLNSVDRVFDHVGKVGCLEIPLTEDARHQLLGCQLEQSLLAEDCGRVGGHIGIFSALLAVLSCVVRNTSRRIAHREYPRRLHIARRYLIVVLLLLCGHATLTRPLRNSL